MTSFSGTVAIRAMKDGDYQATIFPGTTAGLQASIDYLAGGKGKVFLGPGTLETDQPIWVHSYCHLQGSGRGLTVIKRATGTIANGDPDPSAAVIASSAFGSNGTLSSSSETLAAVTISDLTLDGNQSAFAALTDNTLAAHAIYLNYVDGVRIYGVSVQNTLGDAFRVRYCRNVSLVDVEGDTIGQWSQVASKNGVSFTGDYNSVGNWGYNYKLNGARFTNIGTGTVSQDAEGVLIAGILICSISDVTVDGCDFVIECSPTNITVGTWGKWTISNVVATNARGYFITHNIGQSSGYTLEDVVFSECSITGHATLHDGGAISLAPGNSAIEIRRWKAQNCIFKNINTKDTTTHHWVDVQPTNAAGYRDVELDYCQLHGLAGSTRTGSEVGVLLRAPLTNAAVRACYLKDVPGRAVHVSDQPALASPSSTRILLESIYVDGANDSGIEIRSTNATGTGTIDGVRLVNCVAHNTNLQTAGPGFRINITQAGATIKRVYFKECRALKSSGSMDFGLTVARTAGTVDEIHIEDCDLEITAGSDGMFFDSGVTNVHFNTTPGKGPNIASAATISIPVKGDVFHVTGNTNITNGITVKAWDNGRIVTLIFDGTPTVSDTGTSKLAGDFIATADDALTLRCDGTNWYEVARSNN